MADEEMVAGATPGIYEAIGRVANEWAHIEAYVDIEIWALADVAQEAGACISAHLPSMNRRLQSLIALVALRHGDAALIGDLNKFSNLMDGLSKRRNRVVHDPYTQRGEKIYRLQVTAERKPVFQFTRESVDTLTRIHSELVQARQQFDDLCLRLRRLRPNQAWPKKLQ